jgi:hypothetical protein
MFQTHAFNLDRELQRIFCVNHHWERICRNTRRESFMRAGGLLKPAPSKKNTFQIQHTYLEQIDKVAYSNMHYHSNLALAKLNYVGPLFKYAHVFDTRSPSWRNALTCAHVFADFGAACYYARCICARFC